MATLEQFFEQFEVSRALFELLRDKVTQAVGDPTLRISKSQVAFCRRKAFAWAWIPERYLRRKCAPLVLSISLPSRSCSSRWKEIAEPTPGKYMHHLEIWTADDLDEEVKAWLREAWESAG